MPNAPTPLNAALPNLKADAEALDALEEHLFAIRYASDEISSLGSVIDPPNATEDRSYALGSLAAEEQRLLASPETGALLSRLDGHAVMLGGHRADQVRILQRDRAAIVDVPADEQAAYVRLTNEAQDVWQRAKRDDDWASFEPYLQRIVDARVRLAGYRKPGADPYDVCLDEYEHGSSRALYDSFFAQVKDCVVPLLADVMTSRHKPSRAPMSGTFDEARQFDLALDLARFEGIDMGSFWLGRTEHPFTGGPGARFVIVATNFRTDDVLSGVFTMLHEGGHTLYEQGVNPALRRTSLRGGTSSAMHEAISRFYENIVGRSRALSRPLLQIMQYHFRGPLSRVTPNQLYMAENLVSPSLIRTEADELTYSLHILVRYEIEQALMAGEAKAADVPALWAQKYKDYLGLRVPDDARGALQDVHWSCGDIGYFPTYALGNAYGCQLKHAMVADGVDFDGACAAGDLRPINEWLRAHVWTYGRTKDSDQIILDACGEPFDAHYYTDYLTEKFSALYQL